MAGFTASFTGGDSAVTTGTTDGGAAFTTYQLGANAVFGRRSNRAYLATAGTDYAFHVAEGGAADGTLSAKIYNISTSHGLAFRVTDQTALLLLDKGATNAWTVYKREAGAWTALATNSTAGAWVSGDTIAVVMAGTNISVRHNGVEFISLTSSFNSAATKHGIAAPSSTSLLDWDDLVFTV